MVREFLGKLNISSRDMKTIKKLVSRHENCMSEMKNTLYEIIRGATLQTKKDKCQIISLICRIFKKKNTQNK